MTDRPMSREDAQILVDALTAPKQAIIEQTRALHFLGQAVVALVEQVQGLRRDIADQQED